MSDVENRGRSLYRTERGGLRLARTPDVGYMRKGPLRKLPAVTPEAEAEIRRVRGEIRDLYAQVEEASQTEKGKEEVGKRYNRLIDMEVTSPGRARCADVFSATGMNFSRH